MVCPRFILTYKWLTVPMGNSPRLGLPMDTPVAHEASRVRRSRNEVETPSHREGKRRTLYFCGKRGNVFSAAMEQE